MAGDWIKIEHVLVDKPEVFIMAEALKIDPDAVVGKLVRFWSWCDQQTVDGNSLGISDTFIDRLTHQPGFSDALRKVDWLQARSGSLVVPRFDRHNGQTAKARAESARRMAQSRENKRCGDVAEKAQPKPQPEKRREDKEEALSQRAQARGDHFVDATNLVTKQISLPSATPEDSSAVAKESLTTQPDLDAHLNGHDAASAMLVLPDKEKPVQGNLERNQAIVEPHVSEQDALKWAMNPTGAGPIHPNRAEIPEIVTSWYLSRTSVGWVNNGNPIRDWQANLRLFARNWKRNQDQRSSTQTGGHYAPPTPPKAAMRKPQPTTSTLDWGADGPPEGALNSWTK